MNTYTALYECGEDGLAAFDEVFRGQRRDSDIDPTAAAFATRIPGTKTLTIAEFGTAKEMAQAILEAFGAVKFSDQFPNTGLWAWLTFVLRGQLFKRAPDGSWKTGEIHRWDPRNPNDWQKGQRHMVRMPVQLLAQLGESADHLLCGPPWVRPEIREQLTSQQDMFTRSFQQVARALYFDDATGMLRRGAGGKGAGTPRRLARVRQQFDVTWELEDLGPRWFLDHLPGEFARFRAAGSAGR